MQESNHSSSTNKHRAKASQEGPIGVAIVTVSDSRDESDDENAAYLKECISGLGHRLSAYCLIKDEADEVARVLEDTVKTDARIIIFNGGTGIALRDRTFDVLNKKMEKTLPGFGELFRILSYEQVGAAAMLSRATAGVYKGKVVLSIPGSPSAAISAISGTAI